MAEGIEDTYHLAGTLVAGRFAVERAAAQGGSCLVYRAVHVELGTPVALKVLVVPDHLRGSEASLVERFRQEARTLATLAHPAVVRVLDAGQLGAEAGAHVWIALEWLDGVTLDDHVRDDPSFGRSPREALALLTPVFEAIASAHAQGVAHRDLKPTNIMVSRPSRGSVVLRVLDFGIAKAMLPDEVAGTGLTDTRSDVSAFSLPYAAPEQVGRSRTGPWTDVHALGLLLTELLTGRAAYDADNSFALYAAIMASERPTPGRSRVAVGPWEPVLARALALHPAERFGTAQAFHDALLASLEGAQRAWEGVVSLAPPATPAVAAAPARPSRGSRTVWAVAAALGVPLVVFAGWAAVHAGPARAAPVVASRETAVTVLRQVPLPPPSAASVLVAPVASASRPVSLSSPPPLPAVVAAPAPRRRAPVREVALHAGRTPPVAPADTLRAPVRDPDEIVME